MNPAIEGRQDPSPTVGVSSGTPDDPEFWVFVLSDSGSDWFSRWSWTSSLEPAETPQPGWNQIVSTVGMDVLR